MLIEINRGPNGEPGELVDARAYIKQLKARLALVEGQAAALQAVLTAARLVAGDSQVSSVCGTGRIQALVDAVGAYDRRTQL